MKNLNINVGDTAMVDKEIRTVTDIVKNAINQPVIIWQSKHSEGATMPIYWKELVRGIPQDRRRDIDD